MGSYLSGKVAKWRVCVSVAEKKQEEVSGQKLKKRETAGIGSERGGAAKTGRGCESCGRWKWLSGCLKAL